MPFSVRGRIAILFSAIVTALMLIFAIVLQAVEAAQRAEDAEEAVRSLAVRLGTRVRVAATTDSLVTVDASVRPIPRLRARETLTNLFDGIPGYVYVLDSYGLTLLNSWEVRALPQAQRANLDSVAVAVTPAQRIRLDASGNVVASDPFFAPVHSVALRSGSLLVYSVAIELPTPDPVAIGVPTPTLDRVVVAQVLTPTPFNFADLLGPILVLGPLIAIGAIGAAHFSTSQAYGPVAQLIGEVAAVTDGRSLHRRLAIDGTADDQLARLTDTVNAMIGRLEASFSSLRRFTADASHELKTPLTVLRADVERAMAGSTLAVERLEALEEALAETTRMAGLVESLLTLARADEGRFELHREPVNLTDLAHDVYETAVLLGESRDVRVAMSAPERIIVMGEWARLRQLWLNLIENAIKYTPTGGQVSLSLKRSGTSALFSVSDSGIGIAAADLPHVFDRFWRADRARSRAAERSGFGLGLAISQYIAQAHGGSLSAQSRLGRGSTFTVELPVANPPGSPASV